MLRNTLGRRLDKHWGWIIPVAVLLIGLVLVGGVTHHFTLDSIPYHLTRDFGIALIVAAIVSFTFELHTRTRYHLETIREVFDTTMGAIWNSRVWEEARQKIFRKEIIRENFDLHISFFFSEKSDQTTLFPENLSRLGMEIRARYDVRSLLHKPKKVKITHWLDKHICDKENNLPTFKSLQINDKSCDLLTARHKIHSFEINNKKVDIEITGDKVLNIDMNLPNDRPVRVEVTRKEFVYVPGTYNLTMSDITEASCVHLTDLPPNIEASIFLPAHFEEPKTLENNVPSPNLLEGKLLLPGQTMEFHFKRR